MNTLTFFQQTVLAAIQEPLAICERPFETLAVRLGCTEETLLDEIRRLKAEGWIRRFRPQIRYRALGRVAVLAAAAIPEGQLEQTAATVSALAGVSHNYQRSGRLNLWFTLQGTSLETIEETLNTLHRRTGFVFYSFPAERIYKLDVRFDPAGPGPDWFEPKEPIPAMAPVEQVVLTSEEMNVIEAIQRELPLELCPFEVMVKDLSIARPMMILRALVEKGVLNKITAVLDYPRLGYAANAMVCAVVDEGRIDTVGEELSRIPAVTHCYYRRAYPDWPYTLYGMCHADSLDRILTFMQTFCRKYDIAEFHILPTIREFKKKPVHVAF